MPRMRDLLQRFRPISAPGAASAGGVPADRVVDQAAELRQLFAALAVTQAACATLVEEATRAADRTLAEAAVQARTLRESAPARASAERAEAAARAGRGSAATNTQLSEAAVLRAESVGDRARELLPRYVEAVVAATGLR